MSELEILRKRRELVLLSAKLQRETIVRRLDNVSRHPAQAVFGLVGSVASVPLLFKVGTLAFGIITRRRRVRDARVAARRGSRSLFSRITPYLSLLPVFRMFPVLKSFPVLKFLNR